MQEIKHPGIILQETETHFEVLLTEAVSCSGCALQGSCGSSQGKTNTFLLAKENAAFKEGDAVQITLATTFGFESSTVGLCTSVFHSHECTGVAVFLCAGLVDRVDCHRCIGLVFLWHSQIQCPSRKNI
jgi:positive regulator of sigma E activity